MPEPAAAIGSTQQQSPMRTGTADFRIQSPLYCLNTYIYAHAHAFLSFACHLVAPFGAATMLQVKA
eukprot:7805033-Pyramimonas_sp.AAC.1